MKFKKQPEPYTNTFWKSNKIGIALCDFTFGQARVQIWSYEREGEYPDIIVPNF